MDSFFRLLRQIERADSRPVLSIVLWIRYISYIITGRVKKEWLVSDTAGYDNRWKMTVLSPACVPDRVLLSFNIEEWRSGRRNICVFEDL